MGAILDWASGPGWDQIADDIGIPQHYAASASAYRARHLTGTLLAAIKALKG